MLNKHLIDDVMTFDLEIKYKTVHEQYILILKFKTY